MCDCLDNVRRCCLLALKTDLYTVCDLVYSGDGSAARSWGGWGGVGWSQESQSVMLVGLVGGKSKVANGDRGTEKAKVVAACLHVSGVIVVGLVFSKS
jgi:hypothetical protein